MLNPHQSFKAWLDTIDNSNLQDIAFLLSVNPYFKEVRDIAVGPDDIVDKFLEIVNRYSEPSYESADFYVTFKSIFEYYFKDRFTESGWKATENLNKRILEDPNLTPSMIDHLTRMISALPGRMNYWIQLHKRWEALKEEALSDKNISDWREATLFKNFNQELPLIN